MSRKITQRAFELRTWQQEAFRAVWNCYEQTKKYFLCVATPGSGKTKFALAIAHEFLRNNIIDRIVVVTPSDNLKRQWAAEAAAFAGIDLDPDFNNAQGIETTDFHGIVITYALLGQDKNKIQQQNCFRLRTLVILDEVHHAGESLTWGDAVNNSFQDAIFKLSLSGTPFRTDDAKIPFITYDENNTSVSDYNYSYERAILENVCRPVYFSIFDGQMKWKVDKLEFDHSFKDYLTPDQISKRLRTALDPKGNFIRDIIKAADSKLEEIRLSHPDAAGLIFAATQAHAKEISKVINKITGENPPVVISDDVDGSEKISQFKNDSSKWLVSVKMVSEGVDIPRLRVGVYSTIVKSELFFRQAVGRFVRVLSHLQAQDAYIFIPQDKDIVKLAESIQEERDHALDNAKKKSNGIGFTDLFGNDYTPALKGKFVPLGSEATNHKVIAVNVEINSGAKHSIDYRKVESENPTYIQREILHDRLNTLAKRYALKARNGNNNIKPDFKLAHKLWIQQGGKNMDIETLIELKRREQFYINLLRQ